MSILKQLSSQLGDRTESSNRQVIEKCLSNPVLLEEIAGGLEEQDAALLGDCLEIFTEVATQQPAWIVPFAKNSSSIRTLACAGKPCTRWQLFQRWCLN